METTLGPWVCGITMVRPLRAGGPVDAGDGRGRARCLQDVPRSLASSGDQQAHYDSLSLSLTEPCLELAGRWGRLKIAVTITEEPQLVLGSCLPMCTSSSLCLDVLPCQNG